MVQLHSTPFSEIAAHVCGLVAGVIVYGVSAGFTHDHATRLRAGVIASVVCNAIIGGKINVLMHDFLALIVVRPISGFLGAKLLEYVTTTMHW